MSSLLEAIKIAITSEVLKVMEKRSAPAVTASKRGRAGAKNPKKVIRKTNKLFTKRKAICKCGATRKHNLNAKCNVSAAVAAVEAGKKVAAKAAVSTRPKASDESAVATSSVACPACRKSQPKKCKCGVCGKHRKTTKCSGTLKRKA